MTGTDGNIFVLVGKVSSALRRAGFADDAKEMQDKVTASESYHLALGVLMSYVDVT